MCDALYYIDMPSKKRLFINLHFINRNSLSVLSTEFTYFRLLPIFHTVLITCIFFSLYICNLLLDISNYDSAKTNFQIKKYQRLTQSGCKDIRIKKV